MKVLVVGATGYIGAPLYSLLRQSCETLGTSTTGADGLLKLRLEAAEDFDFGIVRSSDIVLLTAATSAPDACASDQDRISRINVTGTATVVANAISQGARVIFFSSDTVYGNSPNYFDETANCSPVGAYASMKHEVETRFLTNPAFKTIRLSYVFSNSDKFTKYLLNCAKHGEEARIFDPFFRAVVHRDDVLSGVIELVRRWDEFAQPAINIGGPEVLSRTNFASTVRDNALPGLHFRQDTPDPDFFSNRPNIINMKSPFLAPLLGYSPRTLAAAVRLEFKEGRTQHD